MKETFIFSSVGSYHIDNESRHKIFKSWNIENVNSACVVFNFLNDFNYCSYFDNVLYRSGFKFPNLFFYITEFPEILDEYKYIGVIDDDLFIHDKKCIKLLSHYMNQYRLSIISPTNSCLESGSLYHIMRYYPNQNKILITNFCEMGFMLIESSFFAKILESYKQLSKQILDYGFDYFICNLANQENKKIGIVKNLLFTNPQRNRKNVADHLYDGNIRLYKRISPKIIDVIKL